MRAIGFCGWAGSGKSSAAGFLVEEFQNHGYEAGDVDMIRFIRGEIIPRYFGITDPDEIERYKFAPPDVMPPGWKRHMRQAMIDLGKACKEIWPMCLISNADKDLARMGKIGIIQNLRTDAEFDHYHKTGLVVLIRRLSLSGQRLHDDQETEKSVDKFMDLPPGRVENADIPVDYVMDNDGSLEELRTKVRDELYPFIEARLLTFAHPSTLV